MLLHLLLAISTLGMGLSFTAANVETEQVPVVAVAKPVLVLYYSSYCSYSQKVLHYLEQIHKTVPMKNVIDNVGAKEELRKYGGIMKVPCLLIDGKPLYESDRIIQWLSQHQDDLDPA